MAAEALPFDKAMNIFTQARGETSALRLRAPPTTSSRQIIFYRVGQYVGDSHPTSGLEVTKRRDHTYEGIAITCALILHSMEVPPPNQGANRPYTDKVLTLIGTLGYTVIRDACLGSELLNGLRELTAVQANKAFKVRVEAMNLYVNNQTGPVDIRHGDCDDLRAAVIDLAKDLGFPPPKPSLGPVGEWTFVTPEANAVVNAGSENARASLYVLCCYLCGRPYAGRSTSIGTARPKNLETTLNNDATIITCLGTLKMEEGAWTQVTLAWDSDFTFRRDFITPLIPYATTPTGGPMGRAAGQIMAMLAFGQLAHVLIIFRFVSQAPFAKRIMSLTQEFQIIYQDSMAFSRRSPATRDYEKVIYRDLFKLYDSKSLRRLTALAVSVLSETDTSLGDYMHDPVDQALRDEYDILANEYYRGHGITPAAPRAPGPAPII